MPISGWVVEPQSILLVIFYLAKLLPHSVQSEVIYRSLKLPSTFSDFFGTNGMIKISA